MIKRRRFKQVQTLEQRLAEEAKRLRAEAAQLPQGAAREGLLRKARLAEDAVRMSDWLRPPSLQRTE